MRERDGEERERCERERWGRERRERESVCGGVCEREREREREGGSVSVSPRKGERRVVREIGESGAV